MSHFFGGGWKPPRKHPYSLTVYLNLQEIYVSLSGTAKETVISLAV